MITIFMHFAKIKVMCIHQLVITPPTKTQPASLQSDNLCNIKSTELRVDLSVLIFM